MPDDPHAQKIAGERQLMKAFGLTRSQLRSRLSAFKEQTDRNIARDPDPTPVSQNLPKLGDEGAQGPIQKFEPRPFVPTANAKTKGGPDQATEIIEDVIIVFNGTAYYCELNGTVGDAV